MTDAWPPPGAPNHWAEVQLTRVAQLRTGHTPSRSVPAYWENLTIPWLTVSDLGSLSESERTVFETKEKISELGLANSAAVLLPAGTVALSRTASVGYSVMLGTDMAVTQGFVAWTCGRSLLPTFLLYQLRAMKPYLKAIARGSTHTTIFFPDVKSLRVLCPSIDDQTSIVNFLNRETARIDELVDKKKRLIGLLEEKRTALISQAVWGAEAPLMRLRYLAGRPTSGNRDHSSFLFTDRGVPCLRGLNIRPGRILADDLLRISDDDHARHATTALRPGDLVLVRSGRAGAAVAIPDDFGPCNCVDLVVVRRTEKLVPRFLEYVVNSERTEKQVRRRYAGAILQHFNAVDAGDLEIPIMDLGEQHGIVAVLDDQCGRIDSLNAALERQVRLFAEYRQALIMASVTGQVGAAVRLAEPEEAIA